MVYLEYLRARRVFVWYALVLVIVALFALAGSAFGNNVDLNVTDDSHKVFVHGLSSLGRVQISMDGLAGFAGLCAIAFATALSGTLNRDTQQAHFLFVRPIARLRMAALTIGFDVVAIVAASLFAGVLAFVTILGMLREHANFFWTFETLPTLLLGLGAGVMWYGMLQLLSSWSSKRAGGFIGAGAGLLGAAIPLSHASFLGALRYVFQAILYVDPLAYFTSVKSDDAGDISVGAEIFVASAATRALIVWVLAAVALAAASFNWKRVEI